MRTNRCPAARAGQGRAWRNPGPPRAGAGAELAGDHADAVDIDARPRAAVRRLLSAPPRCLARRPCEEPSSAYTGRLAISRRMNTISRWLEEPSDNIPSVAPHRQKSPRFSRSGIPVSRPSRWIMVAKPSGTTQVVRQRVEYHSRNSTGIRRRPGRPAVEGTAKGWGQSACRTLTGRRRSFPPRHPAEVPSFECVEQPQEQSTTWLPHRSSGWNAGRSGQALFSSQASRVSAGVSLDFGSYVSLPPWGRLGWGVSALSGYLPPTPDPPPQGGGDNRSGLPAASPSGSSEFTSPSGSSPSTGGGGDSINCGHTPITTARSPAARRKATRGGVMSGKSLYPGWAH